MKHEFTGPFLEKFGKLPIEIQNKFNKQLRFLLDNIRHPSLHAKKYGGYENVWQARVDNNFRFYFKIENDYYTLLSITRHPK